MNQRHSFRRFLVLRTQDKKNAYLGYIQNLRTVCGYETLYQIKGTMRSPHGPILYGESGAIGEREQDDPLFHTLGEQPGVQVLESISSTGAPDPDEVLREFIDVLVEMDGWSKTQRRTVEGTKHRHDLQDVGIDPTLLDLLFWTGRRRCVRRDPPHRSRTHLGLAYVLAAIPAGLSLIWKRSFFIPILVGALTLALLRHFTALG